MEGGDYGRKADCMEIVTLRLTDINPYKRNARKNDRAVDAVVESIRQCEYIAPIVVDENHVILAGHTRWKALKQMGRTEAECVVKSGLADEQKRKYRLLDNKTAELADWDFDLLADELDGLDFEGLSLDWGIDEGEEEKEDYPELEDKSLSEYKYIHYLVTIDVNQHDKIVDLIEDLKNAGAEVSQTKNSD